MNTIYHITLVLCWIIYCSGNELKDLRAQRRTLEQKVKSMRHDEATEKSALLAASNPRVYVLDDFLSDEECDYIIKVGIPLLSDSTMYTGKGAKTRLDQAYRKSQSYQDTGRKMERSDERISKLLQRIHEHVFLPTEYGEDLQLSHYGPGDYYQLHKDTIPSLGRYGTFLIYLNNVTEGGETIFPGVSRKTSSLPQLNWNSHQQIDMTPFCESDTVFKVAPKKGRAVLFFPLNPDMTEDKYSIHGACPVVSGEKWILQRWLRHFTDAKNLYYNSLWLPTFASGTEGPS